MADSVFDKPGSGEDKRVTYGVPLVRLVKRKIREDAELVLLSQPRSVVAEKFRRLKTTIVNDPSKPQVLVVTSPLPADGKSLIAMNLALTFAADQDGEVLLIDADLRRPSVDSWIEPPPKLGLSEILGDKTSLEHCLLTLENTRLRVLTGGAPIQDPMELMTSEACRDLMTELRRRFKVIIVDTPPIVPFADADAIGNLCDACLLIARAGKTTRSMLTQAVDSLSSMPILGTVLNDAAPNLADRDQAYAKYYYSYYDRERRK